MQHKVIDLCGHQLVDGDLNVVRYFDSAALGSDSKWEAVSTKELVVLLDCEEYPELIEDGLQREVVNRVQRLRKKSGLVPTDKVHYYYKILEDPEKQLSNVLIESKQEAGPIMRTLKRVIRPWDTKPENYHCFVEEEQEIFPSKFILGFVRE